LAAGGITDGRDLVAILSLGADGVSIGTRLWASKEAKGPSSFKEALVAAKTADYVIRTRAFDTIWNSYRSIKWPAPFDSSGALRNKTTESWDQRIMGLAQKLSDPNQYKIVEEFKRAENDVEHACVYAGKGVGKIDAIEPAFDIITRIEKEAAGTIKSLQSLHLD
jgi:nitronate monooxygenase